MKKVAIFGLFILSVIGQAQVDPNRVVLTVNGEEVKGSEYYERMEFLPGVGTVRGQDFLEAAPGFLTLNRLIEERLLLQVAKENKCLPTDAEIAGIYAERVADMPNYEKTYTEAGVTKKYVEHQIRLELAQFKLQTMGINVTDQEVDKHYKENPGRFTIGKRVKLSVITVPEFRKDEADKALATKSFAEVAKAMSQDQSAKDGGALGFIFEVELGDQIKAAIKPLKIGGMTAWIKGENAVVKFRVDDIVPEQVKPLDAKMKKDLRRSLMVDRGMAKNNVEALLRAARKNAKIVVNQNQFKSEVTKMLERYKLGG
jgi:parvulin-like peptidyl-prolyl isomerase